MDKKGIKAIFREVEVVKTSLKDEIEKINADDRTSDSWKNVLRSRATEKALEELGRINARAEALIDSAKAEQREKSSDFDYSDERLSAAIRFVRDAGKTTPAPAVDAIIRDFGKRPAELRFLRDALQETGATAQAVVLDEALKDSVRSATFWDRLSDGIFYACNTPVRADFSGLEAELDGVTESE